MVPVENASIHKSISFHGSKKGNGGGSTGSSKLRERRGRKSPKCFQKGGGQGSACQCSGQEHPSFRQVSENSGGVLLL